jgi:predicted nucleotidyltransferase
LKGAKAMTKVQRYNGEYLDQSLEELLDEISNSIVSQYPQARVILFGSYARGDYNKDSDFDICVLVPQITQNRSDLRVDMACTVRDDFPIPFDLIAFTYDEFEEYSKSKSRLQYTIRNEGKVLNG